MGIAKKLLIVLLPLGLYAVYYVVKSYFLIFLVIFNPLLIRLPLERYQDLNPKYEDFVTDEKLLLQEYDFIVVGGGSAGAVVANRLSENESWNILLLEAGGTESILTEIPALTWSNLITDINWNYKTVPNKDGLTSRLSKDGAVPWPRGKVLGGSSALNGMVYTRGNKRDYDHWRDLGNAGWGYEDVLEYFKKSEDNRNKELSRKYHSAGGYLTVEDTSTHPLFKELMEACKTILPFNHDYNGEKQSGCCYYQLTTRNGRRCSTAKAYLKVKRPNLHISVFSHVHKVEIDQITKKVKGVLYKKNNQLRRISVKKEVIMSAGAVASPQLLMLSGIGPSRILNKFGIRIIQEASVGRNLQDHTTAAVLFKFNESVSIPLEEITKFNTFKEFYLNGTGLLTSPSKLGAFISTTEKSKIEDWPEIQINLLPTLMSSVSMNREWFKFDETYWNEELDYLKKEHGITIVITQNRPKSRGYLEIQSANPYDHPLIYPNYYEDEEDLLPVVEAMKMVKKMASRITKYNTTFVDKTDNSCKHYDDVDSDDYMKCFIKKTAYTTFHPAGTCKMGPSTDTDAVVDERLRVYGVEGLRVIDASIMPTVVTGNTNAPAIMIGEKGADLIKEDWKESKF